MNGPRRLFGTPSTVPYDDDSSDLELRVAEAKKAHPSPRCPRGHETGVRVVEGGYFCTLCARRWRAEKERSR